MWYHRGMCTTCNNDETPRPEPVCPRCGRSDDAPNSHDLCETCVEEMDAGYEADDEWAPEDPGIDGDHPTGYEADDERPYGWDVPEEEYPDW